MSASSMFQSRTGRRWLYNIAHRGNVPSILEVGILSHNLASGIAHRDISLAEVQERREKEIREGMGRCLHEYANLYIDARNPMMYRLTRRSRYPYGDICIILVSLAVLDLPGTLVTDMNAASGYARFYEPGECVARLDFDRVYAPDWRDDDKRRYFIKKSQKCAEVLVFDRVDPAFIEGVAVCAPEVRARLEGEGVSAPLHVMENLFFEEARHAGFGW